jgi:hypothetical protein
VTSQVRMGKSITFFFTVRSSILMVGSLKRNTALEYSTRVVQEGDRRCEKSTLNDLAYLTPLRINTSNEPSITLVLRTYRV